MKHYVIIEVFEANYDSESLDSRIISVCSDFSKVNTMFDFMVDRIHEGRFGLANVCSTIRSLYLYAYNDCDMCHEDLLRFQLFNTQDDEQVDDGNDTKIIGK